jgi:DNA repair exonuclease SbcCD ATPase subunit
MFVNNILETVYNNFSIDGFEISETEFNIPYTKNGVKISDVSYASQGERSFLSLALSFALIHKSIKDYNVMLLDEIDATLDTRNRATFINILTQMIELIDSEQVFMITHNNMFDSYPVDIIMTSDVNLDSYKNANVIFKA